MKISKIIVKNFRGIRGEHTYVLPHIAKLTGPNGSGKTSLLDAVRYVTGDVLPEGSPVTNGENYMSVSMFLNGTEYTRGIKISKEGRNAGFCKVDGRKVSKKDFDQAVETELGFSLENIRNVMSADIFKSLDSKGFGKFILSYIPQKLSKAELIGQVPQEAAVLRACEEVIPDDAVIDMDTVDELYHTFYSTRKDVNFRVKSLQASLELIPEEMPGVTQEIVDAKEGNILIYDEKVKAYNQNLARYERDLKQLETLRNSLKSVQDEIAALGTVNAPDPALAVSIASEKAEKQKRITDAQAAVKAAKMSNDTLNRSKQTLSSNACPFSSEIVCTTDKSEILKGIDENIHINNMAIESQTNLVDGLKSDLQAVIDKETAYRNAEKAYEKYTYLQKQEAETKKHLSMVNPVEPEKVPAQDDIETERALVKEMKNALLNREKRQMYEADLEKAAADSDTYQKLVKAFAPDGSVVKYVMQFYSAILDDAVNSTAAKIKDGLKLHFTPENGLKVKANTGNGYISYESLSKGEQTDVIYLIIHLINQLSGSRVLLLDETSVLDDKAFDKLVKTICENSGEYDHIILSGVHGHSMLDDMGIPELVEKQPEQVEVQSLN